MDCEPCILQGGHYELKDAPVGSCPWDKQGTLAGSAVRCTSWEAIFWDYLYYLDEVPQTSWRPKDFMSYAIVTHELGEAAVNRLRQAFESIKED